MSGTINTQMKKNKVDSRLTRTSIQNATKPLSRQAAVKKAPKPRHPGLPRKPKKLVPPNLAANPKLK
jgi:hypothetical protein